MSTGKYQIIEKELREVYELLSKEQLIQALINEKKHRWTIKPIDDKPIISDHECKYSKAMNQPYPRKCIICGKPEKV